MLVYQLPALITSKHEFARLGRVCRAFQYQFYH